MMLGTIVSRCNQRPFTAFQQCWKHLESVWGAIFSIRNVGQILYYINFNSEVTRLSFMEFVEQLELIQYDRTTFHTYGVSIALMISSFGDISFQNTITQTGTNSILLIFKGQRVCRSYNNTCTTMK